VHAVGLLFCIFKRTDTLICKQFVNITKIVSLFQKNNVYISEGVASFTTDRATQAPLTKKEKGTQKHEKSHLIRHSSTIMPYYDRHRAPVNLNALAQIDSLSNLDLIIFTGCSTAGSVDSGLNLTETAIQKGATAAVGFTEPICDIYRNLDPEYESYFYNFFDLLFSELADGKSLEEACNRAKSVGGNFDSFIIEYKSGINQFYFS